jgi:cell division septation protein DedD
VQAPTRLLATSFVMILALLLPPAARAQRAGLDQVDSLANAGQAVEARAALDLWRKSNAADARSTFLSARLALRAEDAEDAYLAVALSHPTSPYAAESLLRLGQARLTAGDPKQAAFYLRRVLSDYPRSEHREAAQQWLQRTVPAESIAAAAPDAPKPKPVPRTLPVPEPNDITPSVPLNQPTLNVARIAIQVAAFREMAGARSVAAQLRRAGITNVRLVTVPENGLIRVRVGTFQSSAAAATTVSKIKAEGLSAVIVSDVQREQLVRE